jgi:DNA-binding transcriptional LysR family regulator
MFGRLFVAPGILDYLNRYPDVQVSALFLDRVVNMLEEGVDVAVRLGDLPDSSLRAITVGHVRRLVCASPEYLSVHGTPQRPPELTPHLLITSTTISSATEWKFLLDGHPYVQKITPRLTVSNNDAALEAALSGFGITRLMSYQVASHIEAGRLQVILQTFETAEIPIQVVHRENRYGSAKVRSFIDLMVERLRTDPRLSAMS